MIRLSSFRLSGACVSALVLLASCSDNVPFVGSWTASAPADVTRGIQSATSATSLVKIEFLENQQKTDGPVTLSCSYDIVATDGGPGAPVETFLTATASVNGTWTFDVDDDDDLLLTFDYSTVGVTVNPQDISFKNVGRQQVDSLTQAAAGAWKHEINRAFRETLMRYSVIEDIEVSKDRGVMSLEIQSPETKVRFVKTKP